ncbi:30S ribosomal protein S18 [Capsicum annuum]|nr:30S ribosomal protein S18 [Capsicum annuum]KAF3637722.1 30S ribosomal protein S18 [Capsicum annuum]
MERLSLQIVSLRQWIVMVPALSQGPQAGSSTGPQGHYAPAIAGGIAQPRPTQPLPVESIPDLHSSFNLILLYCGIMGFFMTSSLVVACIFRRFDLLGWNVRFLTNFITEAGILVKRSKTGISAKAQRKIAREIKTARAFGLMPFTTMGTKQFVFGRTMEDLDARILSIQKLAGNPLLRLKR